MPREEIRQVIRGRLIIGQRGKLFATGIELVAVCTGQALNSKFHEYLVQQATSTAIGVRNENVLELGTTFFDLSSHGTGNLLRTVVQVRWQALDLDV